MTLSPDLKSLTIDELVELFAHISEARGDAIFESVLPPDDPSVAVEREAALQKSTELFWKMKAVDDELRLRGLAARRALMRLYDYPDWQVRLDAARSTLGIAYDQARGVIQTVATSKSPDQSFDAKMTLASLDRGEFKPD